MPHPTIHFVALGCPKNRVDTERMVGLARRLGHELVFDPADAEVIVVNTCGFILRATEESIDTVLELALHKRGRCRTLVVAGCLAQRYPEELARELPEVDHFIGTGDLPQLEAILEPPSTARAARPPRLAVGQPGLTEEAYPRALVGPTHMAYLKIAEGCDRSCSFCIIPALRGPQRSRSLDSLVAEAEQLCAAGARELVLVAQDTTAWGRDLEERPHLAELLAALDGLGPPLRWIRLLYAYPSAVGRRLVEAMARLPRVVPYLDLPLQHVDDRVLRRMRRGYTGDRVRRVINGLRRAIPGVFLRGTIIAGHPGENADAHRRLLDFVGEAQLEHLGVFTFSPEDGTAAATDPNPVPAALAKERAAELMERQRLVSRCKLARLRGQALEVIVDGPSEESEFLVTARHAGQAPEVDGVVILKDCACAEGSAAGAPRAGAERPTALRAGELLAARVTDSGDYDLVATPVE